MSEAPSFLFIVNELPTNDDPDVEGGILPRMVEGLYHPPQVVEGFRAQIPGYIFRWKGGFVSVAEGYSWWDQPIGNPPYANGTIYANSTTGVVWPECYRAATVFYSNHFTKFETARGDASARNMSEANWGPEDSWQRLVFDHEPNNLSLVQHAAEHNFLAVREASWIEQLLPRTYRRKARGEPVAGGLSGLLPIIIALVAFSCVDRDELWRALIDDRAWRGHRWVPHQREAGRVEGRGMVVSVYLDPENPTGSTYALVQGLEIGPTPIFR